MSFVSKTVKGNQFFVSFNWNAWSFGVMTEFYPWRGLLHVDISLHFGPFAIGFSR